MQPLEPGGLVEKQVDLGQDEPILEIVIDGKLVTVDLRPLSDTGYRLQQMRFNSEEYNLVIICDSAEDDDGKTLVTASLDPVAVAHTTTC